MAWLNWLTGKSKTASKASASAQGLQTPASDVLNSSQISPTRPLIQNKPSQPPSEAGASRTEQRRQERNVKRELLFQVVRESMVRSGVLSSAFKFKVLSLDQRGRSFLVMIDLAVEFSGEAQKLAEIEHLIISVAKSRYHILVQAVYWRYFEFGQHRGDSNRQGASSAPAPLLGTHNPPISRPAPLAPLHSLAQAPSQGHAQGQRHEALAADEVHAFKRALASSSAAAVAGAGAVSVAKANAAHTTTSAHDHLQAARDKLLLTGYEETEIADEADPSDDLSGTQHGDLPMFKPL